MREIKFRAWEDQSGWSKEPDIGMLNFEELRSRYEGEMTDMFGDGDITLMQYTGLKDKNGKEIYEGDICHYYDTEPDDQEAFDNTCWPDTEYTGNWHDVELTGVVEFKDFGFLVGGTRWFDEKTEVIGNIYENPELMVEQ